MRFIPSFLMACVLSAALPAQAANGAVTDPAPRAYVIFSVRIQDWMHFSESADTVIRLIEIFDRNKVRADFLIAGPVADKYARTRPDAISALRNSKMTIGYHLLPPHPAHAGFDQAMRELDSSALSEALPQIERFGVDQATGATDTKRPGGYGLVAELFERPPTVVWPATGGRRIHSGLCELYERLGTRMLILKSDSLREARTAFVFCNRMLIRPNDIPLTQWRADGETTASAWWDRIGEPAFNPVERIKTMLPQWKGERPPYIVCEMDDNVFVRRGPVAWTPYYYDSLNRPLKPPFNMQAADPSTPRPKEEQNAIWQSYEALVIHAAKNFKVVTSDDVLRDADSNGHTLGTIK